MKRYSLLLTISVALILAAPAASFAQYPPPDQSVVLPMGMGWFNDTPAWFVSTATMNINSLAAAPVYITTNSDLPQGPVFSAAPGADWPAGYSGVWRVVYVAWSPWAVRMPLTSERQIIRMASAGMLSLQATDITAQYPIVVVGLLGDPLYVAPEVMGIDFARAQVELPAWRVYGWNDSHIAATPADSGEGALAAGGAADENSSYGPFDMLMRMARFPLTPQGTVLTDWSDVLSSPAPTGPTGTQ
jgi:hypothetical protein